MKSMVSHTSMEEVANAVLESAVKEIEELGRLFIEDQFRHIVVTELNKNTNISGNFTPGGSYPKIVLEFMWKKGGNKMDIAILGSSTKGKSDRYSYAKTNPQPLAIELKVSKDKTSIKKDVSRVRNFLRPGGKSTFKNGMVLVGSKTDYRPSETTISATKSGFLFGCIDNNDQPLLLWLNKPQPPKPKKKSRKTQRAQNNQSKCQAKYKRDGRVCGKGLTGKQRKYCTYHKDSKKRRK